MKKFLTSIILCAILLVEAQANSVHRVPPARYYAPVPGFLYVRQKPQKGLTYKKPQKVTYYYFIPWEK